MKTICALSVALSLLFSATVRANDALDVVRFYAREAVGGGVALLPGFVAGLCGGTYAGYNPDHAVPAGIIAMFVAYQAGSRVNGMFESYCAKPTAAVGAAIGFSAMYAWTRMMRSSAHARSNEPHTHSQVESVSQEEVLPEAP